MSKETVSSRTIDSRLLQGLRRNYPTNEKDIEVGKALMDRGEYKGYFSTEDTERVISQITHILVEENGIKLLYEFKGIPFIGNKLRGSFKHRVVRSEVVRNSKKNELDVNIETQISYPLKVDYLVSYPLLNDPSGETIKVDFDRLETPQPNVRGILGEIAVGMVDIREVLIEELQDINKLVEKAIAIPMRVLEVDGNVSVKKLQINAEDKNKVLLVHLQNSRY